MVCRSMPNLQSKAMNLLDFLSLVLDMLKKATMLCRSVSYLQHKVMDLLDSLSIVLPMQKNASHGL